VITTRAQELARRFAPVGLEELDLRASLQNRMDEKYIVTWEQLEVMLEHLVETHEVLEIAGRRTFTYDTVYFDSESLDGFRAHVQRRRRRYKARTRRYIETNCHQLQVKLKGRRGETVKHSIDRKPEQHGLVDHQARLFIEACLRDNYGHELLDGLKPTLRTTYGRMTFAPPDGSERVTVDFDMLVEASDGTVACMRADRVIVEVKSARENGPAAALMHRLGVRPAESCSKYCLGVSLTTPGVKSNDFRRLMVTHFDAPIMSRLGGSLRSGVDHAAVQARPDLHARGGSAAGDLAAR
jgi:hypothetical protein